MLDLLDRQREALRRALAASSHLQGLHDGGAAGSSTTPAEAKSTESSSIPASRGLSWLPECSESHGLSEPAREALQKLRSQMEMGFYRRREAFVKQVFDKHKSPDGSPGISKASLTCALEDLGIFVSDGEAEELFYTQDMNRDGWIELSEFLPMASRVGRVEQWVRVYNL